MAPFLGSSTPTSETDTSSSAGESQNSWNNDAASKATPIAVCGMALRLPGGIATPEQFWDFLINKQDARAPIPESRFNGSTYHSKSGKPGHVRTDHGYFLDESVDLGALDSTFFSMPKIEVERIDPQQRLLLELTRECLESAGETDYRGKTIGTFVGSFGEDWQERFSKDDQVFGLYKITGYQDFVLANRISYEYDLRGPSITIRTACSSALIGIHEACLAIRTGQCNAALVGGSNLIMAPQLSINMSEQGVLSPNASCRTFDANANGYARAEAVNVVYLKKLDDAIRDGNPIRAIIRGSCSNADGKTTGLSVPNWVAHEEMIRRAYAGAGIADPNDTAFVECHGTGTPVGDPIETKAVANVFGDRGVYIGSVKPNVGHSEGASGITSLIKSVLALEHQTIPPNIKFDTPNPKIPFVERKLKVPVEATPWPQDRSERVSVNSFGIGGANVHVILDSAKSFLAQFPAPIPAPLTIPITAPVPTISEAVTSSPQLAIFSANTADSLRRQVVNNQKYMEDHPESLADTVYTLGARRTNLPHRAFSLVGAGMEPNTSAFTKAPTATPDIVMVFTGQGAQWPRMGAELLQSNPKFASTIRDMDKALAGLPDAPSWTIVDELLKPAETSNLSKAAMSQPLCTALQVGLVAALADIGIHPRAVVGHSSGEMAAAYAAGRLSASEAIIAAYYRGVVSGEVTKQGGMAAVGLGWEEVSPFLVPGVVTACENSPSSVTISGDKDSLEGVLQSIRDSKPGVLAKLLKVDKAYHSHHMKEVGDRYEALVSRFVKGVSDVTNESDPIFFSSVACKRFSAEDSVGASYWRSNLESPVRFRTAVSNLVNYYKSQSSTGSANLVFLEVGPHSALAGPLRQTLAQASINNSPYSSCLVRFKSGSESFLSAVGQLWTHNVDVDFGRLTNPYGTAHVVPDLPTYPWQHTQSHLFDTRLARAWREHKFPRHELLGNRIAQSTDNDPSWRVVLILDHVPWVRDHNIKGDVIFPCAGYVGIVGEAARQMCISTSTDSVFAGFSLRNMVIDTAMVLNDSKSVEIVTSLHRQRLTDSLDSAWYEFTISSYNGTGWTRHCIGQVCARTSRPSAAPKVQQAVTEKLPRSVEVSKWYEVLSNVGANYGPFFQGLKDVSCSTTEHVARARAIHTSHDDEVDYSVHPTKIDFFLQLFSVAAFKGVGRKMDRMAVPTFIEAMDVYKSEAELDIRVEATVTTRGMICGAGETCDTDGNLALSMKGVKLSPLDNDAAEENPDPHAGARISWMPDVDFLKVVDLVKPNQEQAVFMPKLQQLTLLCIQQSLQRFEHIDTTNSLPYMRSFVEWMKKQPLPVTDETIETLVSTISPTTLHPLMAGVIKVFENLEPIIRGEVESLEVLMPDNTLGKIYDYLNNCDRRPLFQALGHAKPNMRILEIGAGTGGTTQIVLDYLVKANGGDKSKTDPLRLYSHYTYTDISAGFFAAAKDRFKDYPNMSYQALDISRDPAEQGLELGSFDLIMAANVLHATPRLHETLANVRKLLRPDGRLYLEELCCEVKPINYIMGVLPGWWLGNADGRHDEPYVQPTRWNEELSAAGFAGLDDFALDSPSPNQLLAFMTAKPASEKTSQKPDKKTTLLLHDGSAGCLRTIDVLTPILSNAGYEISTWDFVSQGLPPTENDIISVLDLHTPFFEGIDAARFDSFRELMTKLSVGGSAGAGLLWLTRTSQVGCSDPRWAQTVGAARTIRGDLSVHLATCELDNIEIPETWDLVSKVFGKFYDRRNGEALGENAADILPEYEYAIVDGEVRIPRIYPVDVKEELKTVTSGDGEVLEYDLTIGKYGRLNTMQWSARPEREVGREEVLVDMKAVSLNFKDVLIAMGIVDSNFNGMGLEGAGIVRRVGDDVKDLLPGDRVFLFGAGCFSTGVICAAKLCVKIPDSLSFEEAAGMPTIFSTVIRGLIDLGRLQAGESVLIHSACGGVGLSAIQIAKMVGANIFCTVSNEEKIKHLVDNYGIPRNHIFQSRDDSFKHDVLEATNGRGVDVVLNSLSGELLHASWECVAVFGRMIEIGKRDLIGNGKLALNVFELNRSYYGLDLGHLVEVRHDEANRLLKEIIRLYEEGHIQPVRPIQTWPAKSAEECFRYMQKGKHIGKIIVSIDLKDIKEMATIRPREIAFKSDASYLLAGGLGGLGKVVSTWMVEHGARHLVYLSPSAGKSAKDQAFLEELRSEGCSATAISGSVTSLVDVERAIAAAPSPLKGLINMCMVLRDQGFSGMTHSEWTACVEPKVQGTWTLHKACEKLEQPLDFFAMFSSISGIIGQRGQANYASANTFLDAFVQYRKKLGLPACAVDVGAMLDHGYVAENQRLRERMQGQGWYGIRVPELLDALTAALFCGSESLALPSKKGADSEDNIFSNPAQLVIGMRSLTPLDDPTNRVIWKTDRRMAIYHNSGHGSGEDGTSPADAGGNANVLGEFLSLASADPSTLQAADAPAFVGRQIAKHLLKLLLRPVENDDEIDVTQSLQDIGLDSLVAIEIRSWWKTTFGFDISVLEMLGSGSMLALGEKAVEGLKKKYDDADGVEQGKHTAAMILETKMP